MPISMIRYQVADAGIPEVTRAIETAFAAVERAQPKGVRWAYGRRAGSNELIGLLILDEGIENPLPSIEAARALQSTVAKWAVGGPPVPQPIELLGAYGFERAERMVR